LTIEVVSLPGRAWAFRRPSAGFVKRLAEARMRVKEAFTM
jgi:hypothetical protein